MQHIDLSEGVRIRFPGRSEDFDQGVEIGILAVLMDLGEREFSRWVSAANLDQIRALARQLRYQVVEGARIGDRIQVILRSGAARPNLRLVHSA
jgi:hypothetical protein